MSVWYGWYHHQRDTPDTATDVISNASLALTATLMIHFPGPVSFPSKHHLRVPPPLSTRRQSCHLVTSITILDVGIDNEGLRISTVALICWGPCGFSSSLPQQVILVMTAPPTPLGEMQIND